MKCDLLIKGGKIFTAEESFKCDIAIKNDKIIAIGKNLPSREAKRVINAQGKYVIPGGIDVHVHFELPFCGTVSADDFYTGTKAAACGGVTTVIDFATQDTKRGLLAGIEARRKIADPKVCVDYSLHASIIRWTERTPLEISEAITYGVPTFKMFMIYEEEGWQSDDAALFSALELSDLFNFRLMVHAESERVMKLLINHYLKQKKSVGAYGHTLSRPNFIEAEAIQRAITWTAVTGGRLYIVHMSTSEGTDLVKTAQAEGVNVLAETCPQYLLLQDDVFKDKKTGHLYATCPQIKKKEDNMRLWLGIMDGEISVVSTDTCTFTKKQKALWKGDFTKIPYGLPGVETLIPLLYTYGVCEGRITMNRLVEVVSTNPAKIMGMYPQKGSLMIGTDADITIFDPKKTTIIDYKRLATNCDWSPYQGWKVKGFPEYTILRGNVIVDNGEFCGSKGFGKFIQRKLTL
ncbi:dihydropyrimidinase [Candidatus Sumerlaeota bacterium]|nr:dihydropyrimidinase [Candidatus Sumerlaeota bacterium]